MQTHKLIITFPGKGIARHSRRGRSCAPESWLYLGQDYFERCKVERQLGGCYRRLDIARLHDEVAESVRGDYVSWIDALNRTYGADVDWWFEPLSSRNVYHTHLFQYLCYLEIVRTVFGRGEPLPTIVVVESPALARSIAALAAKSGVGARIEGAWRGRLIVLRNFMRNGAMMARFVREHAARKIWARVARRDGHGARRKNNPDVMIDTFLHEHSISHEGIFTDRYFPSLYEYLKREGREIAVRPVICGSGIHARAIYQRLRKSRTVFYLQEDVLRLSDYGRAILHPLKALFRRSRIPACRGHECSDMVAEERLTRFACGGADAVLNYWCYIRLGETGLRPKAIIKWYENQVIDKAMICGARRRMGAVPIIGVQMFIHPPNYVSLYPSASEVEARVVPDAVLATSEGQCDAVKTFAPALAVRPAAALRYAHVFRREGQSAGVGVEDRDAVLVLLPYSRAEGAELLALMKEWSEQNRAAIRVLIKGHPDYAGEDPAKIYGRDGFSGEFEMAAGTLRECFEKAFVVVSANTSSMVEAAAYGIPVIVIGRQTALTMNPLEGADPRIAVKCFTVAELAKAIESRFALRGEGPGFDAEAMGAAVRERYFTAISEQTLRPYDVQSRTMGR